MKKKFTKVSAGKNRCIEPTCRKKHYIHLWVAPGDGKIISYCQECFDAHIAIEKILEKDNLGQRCLSLLLDPNVDAKEIAELMKIIISLAEMSENVRLRESTEDALKERKLMGSKGALE